MKHEPLSFLRNLANIIRYGRKYKDSFFCDLFGHDRKALLELYNALNDSDYKDPAQIEVVTIENAIYITTKNDVAYLLDGVINLYEHQSTYNPNMPVRFLVYLGQEYQNYLSKAEDDIYGKKLLTLPTPKCVVFYNGSKEMPARYDLRLSDSFLKKDVEADAELVTHVYNVNAGYNTELMDKCSALYGYSVLIGKIGEYQKTMKLKGAIDRAIRECIEEDILKEYLLSQRSEVLGMLLFDYDRKKHEKGLREEGLAEGLAKGEEERLALQNELDELRKENERLKELAGV